MTNKATLLADVAELSNVLRTMDEWEAAGGDLDSAHGRKSFVDGLGNDAADELAGLALTNLLRRVLDQKMATGETGKLGKDLHRACPDHGSWSRHEYRRVAA